MSSNFFFENFTVYTVENTVRPNRPQMKTWCMRIGC